MTFPLMGGCMDGWVDGWVDGWGHVKSVNGINLDLIKTIDSV